MERLIELFQETADVLLPVMVGLVFLLVIISFVDRHPRSERRPDRRSRRRTLDRGEGGDD